MRNHLGKQRKKGKSSEWRWWIGNGVKLISAAGIISFVFYRSLAAGVCLLPVMAVRLYKNRKGYEKEQTEELEQRFCQGIRIVSGLLSAGMSVEHSFQSAAAELQVLYGAQSRISRIFCEIVRKLEINQPLEEILIEFAYKNKSSNIQTFAEIFSVARRSRGELRQVIGQTVFIISEKKRIDEEIITMLRGKMFEQKIMTMLPLGVLLYLNLTASDYLQILYTTAGGRAVMTGCLLVYIGAAVMAERIVQIRT